MKVRKEKREAFKQTDEYQKILDAKKETHDTRVNYGGNRNFEKCDLDLKAAKDKLEHKEYKRERAEKERLKKEAKEAAAAAKAYNPDDFKYNPQGKVDVETTKNGILKHGFNSAVLSQSLNLSNGTDQQQPESVNPKSPAV